MPEVRSPAAAGKLRSDPPMDGFASPRRVSLMADVAKIRGQRAEGRAQGAGQ